MLRLSRRVGSASLVLFAACLACAGAACGSDESDGTPPADGRADGASLTSIFTLPATVEALEGATFFDHPWPSDWRTDADGTARFSGWPNPFAVSLLTTYADATKGLFHGFSPAAASYLRFTASLDPASLPADPAASVATDSSVQIIDVDPNSPERGSRHLALVRWQDAEGAYIPAHTLAVMPMLGRPLRPSTRYAVVVTKKLRAAGGGSVGPSAELQGLLGIGTANTTGGATNGASQAVRAIFEPAIAELERAGIARTDVVHLTTFTTNDPTAETFAIMDDVLATVPAPQASAWQKKEARSGYIVYEGSYGPSPNYQAGTVPFAKASDGGSFVFENGKPKLQDTFDPRFALAVPIETNCPMPPGGYPIVLYAHGTGGDYRSFIGDGTAAALASNCLASMGVDQIFHGTRPGAPAADDPARDTTIQLLFFNLNNPLAARTSNRQSSIDVLQEARLFTETHAVVPASVSASGQDIAFDASKILFFGHSQGGLNGPLFLAGSRAARGGVLSGAGSALGVALLEKKKPIDVSGLFGALIGLTDPEQAKELDIFHPVITLTQSLVDAADPLHYGAFITRSPRADFAPKSIYQTEGVAADGTGDSYAPPHGIEALAVAIGLPRMSPGTKPVAELGWAGIADVAIPAEGLRGNLAGGQASGVLAQFVPPSGEDGHFVVFDVPEARAQAAAFEKNLADDPVGRVPAP